MTSTFHPPSSRLRAAIFLALLSSASASIPVTQSFDLPDDPSTQLWTPSQVNLKQGTVMQSFAIDNPNHFIYAVQLTDGSAATSGNLTVTQLSWDGQTVIGSMFLTGFGHGVQLGVEPSGTDSYLWTEVNAVSDGTNAWGSKIGRFKFVAGATLATSSSSIAKFALVSGESKVTCNLDMFYSRLALHYTVGAGRPSVALYDLASVKTGGTTPLATYSESATFAALDFQGFTTYGSWLYLLTGDNYSTGNPSPGNTKLTIVNWNSPGTETSYATNAGTSLTWREPAGMAIMAPRLNFGFATGTTDDERQAALYYKDQLVPGTQSFDLPDDPSTQLWTPSQVNLKQGTVLQSFAIDNTNHYIYTVQVTDGSDRTLGNLTLTQLSWDGQTVLGYMFLTGFGHGVQIGVEPVGADSYLWTEVDSVSDGTQGWGSRIGRFKFVTGTTLNTSSSSITKYTLVSGARHVSVNLDLFNNQLTSRYITGASGTPPKVSLYSFSAVKAGGTTPLATYTESTAFDAMGFNGYATYGSYLYMLTGSNYSTGNPPPGNTELSIVNWASPATETSYPTNAGTSLTWREPEGMSIMAPRLCFGFATGTTSDARQAALYYKDQLH